MRGNQIGLCLVLGMFACTPPESPVDEPPPVETVALVQVESLTARLNDVPAVVLRWHDVPGASGYKVFRDATSIGASPVQTAVRWAGKVVGSAQYGSVITTESNLTFTDKKIERGTRYTYRVAAVHLVEEGPLSDAASVEVPTLEEPKVKAPAVPSYYGESEVDLFANALGTPGGNSGLATVTTYPGTAAVAACGEAGAAFTTVRPAARSLLSEGEQTFSVAAVYNRTEPTTFAVAAFSSNSGDMFGFYQNMEPIYYREIVLPAGCAVTTATFTIDTALLNNESIIFVYALYDDADFGLYLYDSQTYWRSRGGHIRIDSTNPAPGGELGASPLQISASYAGLPTGVAEFTVSADDEYAYGLLANAVTDVSGSGAFTLNLDHRQACGIGQFRLTFAMNVHSRSYSDSVTFSSDVAGKVNVWPGQTIFWATSTDGFATSIQVQSCDGSPHPFTAMTEAGLMLDVFSEYDYDSGTTIQGFTGDHVELYADVDTWGNWGYGTFVSSVTFSFGAAAAAVTIPIEIHTYDLFWTIPPPETAAGLQGYDIEITGANLPVGFFSVGTYQLEYDYGQLWADSPLVNTAPATYAGEVTFGACGYSSTFVNFAWGNRTISPSSLEAYTDVISSPFYRIESYPDYIGFDFSDPQQEESQYINLSEACGQTFQWQIVAADAWMEFDTLANGSDTPIRLHVIESEVPFEYYNYDDFGFDYAYGELWVDTNLPGISLHIGVSAYR